MTYNYPYLIPQSPVVCPTCGVCPTCKQKHTPVVWPTFPVTPWHVDDVPSGPIWAQTTIFSDDSTT